MSQRYELPTVRFETLRDLRDHASKLGMHYIVYALDELIHLRSSREKVMDGVASWYGCDTRIMPEDLK